MSPLSPTFDDLFKSGSRGKLAEDAPSPIATGKKYDSKGVAPLLRTVCKQPFLSCQWLIPVQKYL